MNGAARSGFSERTAWARNLQTPLRNFLSTESSSALVLLGAALAALAWANIDHSSYEELWRTRLSIRVGDSGISQDLRQWVNNGLMTFFFFVVGLELRREFDVGELRERARLTLPVLAGLGGMAVPALIFLAFNAGKPSAHAWAAAISTDTAFALGMLALVGSRFPARLRVFLLTITVLDDVVALGVIVFVYSGHIDLVPLLIAAGIFAAMNVLIALRIRGGPLYFLLMTAAWVPLFVLANVGIAINGDFLSSAYTSPITLGILFGYVLGKPVGIGAMAWLVTRISGGRLRPPVGWAGVAGAGAIAGIGFTVSILIASIALHGVDLKEAKLGVLSAAVVAPALTWLIVRITATMPRRARIRALFGTSESIVDLAAPVNPDRDHIRGPREGAPVTLVEYGDFECPYCGRAEPIVRELLSDFTDIRYVWRHLPLSDVHPNAQQAAEAAEAADRQGAFWEMHDLMLDHQDALQPDDLLGYAEQLNLDLDRFQEDLRDNDGTRRVEEDVDSADRSGVAGTPTFFINERRHDGAYDIDTLSAAVRAAGARSLIA